ncbi:unnamed protein product, partial [Didymodactylos carnosus]
MDISASSCSPVATKEALNDWLTDQKNPWEIIRSEIIYPVHFYGKTVEKQWIDTEAIIHLHDDKSDFMFLLTTLELMRLLIDQEHLSWNDAWSITTKVVNIEQYNTKFTMPSSYIKLLTLVLPRNIEIMNEIDVSYYWEKNILPLKQQLFHIGISHYRWLLKINPHLSNVIAKKIGLKWLLNFSEMKQIETFVDDKIFLNDILKAKEANKKSLVFMLENNYGIGNINVKSLFDVQVKHIKDYKRHLLNCLYIITTYNRMKRDYQDHNSIPKTFIFGGKINGALTVCTINASTIDLVREIGQSNMFIFGMKKKKDSSISKYSYTKQAIVQNNFDLQEAILQIKNGFYSNNCTDLCEYLHDDNDKYMILADYESYIQTQEKVSQLFK